MAERYPEVTTIQGAINTGAARLVSSFQQGFLREFGYLPPWQKVQNYVKVVFPSLRSNQRARIREYGMAAALAGRYFQAGAAGSRSFESVAPEYQGRVRRLKSIVRVPVESLNRQGSRQRIGTVQVTVYTPRNATKADIEREVMNRLGPAEQYTYTDTYGRTISGFRRPQYGEPIVASVEHVG